MCCGHQIAVDIIRPDFMGSAEIGRHRPLCVWSDHDQAACRRRPTIRHQRFKTHTGGADVVGEDLTKLIVANLADEAGAAADGFARDSPLSLVGGKYTRYRVRDGG